MDIIIQICLFVFLTAFFIIKGYLSEKDIISDECNECINRITTTVFS